MLHHCVESAGARCLDCSQPGSVDLKRLTAKESVVVGLDEDMIGKLEAGHRKWVEQVYNFLEGYVSNANKKFVDVFCNRSVTHSNNYD